MSLLISRSSCCLWLAIDWFFFAIISHQVISGQLTPVSSNHDDIMFGIGVRHEIGKRADVALINENLVIQVHQNERYLYYKTGFVQNLVVAWNAPPIRLDRGDRAQIAANENGELIVVYEKDASAIRSSAKKLWYRVGRVVQNGSVSWGKGLRIGAGAHPTVALSSNGTVVLAFQTETRGIAPISFKIGKLQANSYEVNFTRATATLSSTGAEPLLSMNNRGQLVIVYRNNELLDTGYGLFYAIGRIDESIGQSHIMWTQARTYSTGSSPAVSISDRGTVVEVHQDNSVLKKLFSRTGVLDMQQQKIVWTSAATYFDTGDRPSVALKNDIAVQVHHSSSGMSTVWYTVSLVMDRVHWMENSPELLERPLWQVTLPATHDSGAYNLSAYRATGCGNAPAALPGSLTRLYAKTQTQNILNQLRGGIRFFDIRPYFWLATNNYHAYHDNIGEAISSMLDQILAFFSIARKELVILTISHFCSINFNNATHQGLTNLIANKLGQYLYRQPWTTNLLTTKIGDYLSEGSRVLVIYEEPFVETLGSGSGFWPELKRFDQYSNTEYLNVMVSDQLQKLKANPGSQLQLFLLSFTLTFRRNILVPLHELTKSASESLAQFLNVYGSQYLINFVYVDYFQEARATDLAVLLNRQRRIIPAGDLLPPSSLGSSNFAASDFVM